MRSSLKKNLLNIRLVCCLILICSFQGSNALAQLCGTDLLQQKMWQANPQLAQQAQANTVKWGQYMQLMNNAFIVSTPQGPVYEIPVVIHVMHTGGAIGTMYNPTDASLLSMIDYLNQTYAATYSSYPDTNNGGTRLPIRFVMAKRTPTCDSTTGIVRINASATLGSTYTNNGVNASNTNGIDDSTLKALSIWNTYDYLNIWVVNRIDGANGTVGTFVAGFAYTPPVANYLDGVIMLATQSVPGQITLPHEVGHYFGLLHTFEGGSVSSCPTNTNCNTQGDQICDTEPEKQSNFNCPSNPNPCTGNSYNFVQHNFMDYSSCQDRFTAGQKTRMVYKLTNLRQGLLSSYGSVYPTGTSVVSASCTPGIANTNNNGDMGPTLVVLNDLQANSGGYNSDGNISYRNETCLQHANLISGHTYTLSVTIGAYNSENVKAWIDTNNDGTFQANELVLTGTNIAAGQTASSTITIPATGAITCTPLRMRVMSDYHSSPAPSACSNVQYGQTEDYAVYITNPSSASIALTTGTNPGCIGASRTFTASSTNLGTNPAYNWYVNNTLVSSNSSTYTTSTLNNGDSIRVKAYATTTGCRTADTMYSSYIHMSLSNSVATPTAGSNSHVCSGNTLNLTASTITNATYTWSGPNGYTASTQNPSIANTIVSNSGTYSVVASVGGCYSVAANVAVVIDSTPYAPVANSNSPVCVGNALNLSATSTNSATYAWSGPASYTSTTQNPSIANAQLGNSGQYTVTAKLGNCTSSVTTITATVNASPGSLTAGSNSHVCSGNALNLTVTTVANATYAWTGPNSYTASTQNPTLNNTHVNNSGTYSVTATVSGCSSAAATVAVVIDSTPYAPTASSNSPICVGSSLNLTATSTNNATYTWSGPGSYSSTTQNPSISNAQLSNGGQYTVSAKLGNCTSGTTNITATVSAIPATPTASSNSPVCAGATLNLNTPSVTGATFTWSGPSAFSSSTQNPTVANAQSINAGKYIVSITVGGCTSKKDTINVVITPNVTPTVTINPSTAVGGVSANFKAIFTNGGSAPTFQWLKNGVAISGATDSLYNNVTLKDGDTLCVQLTSTAICATPNLVNSCIYATVGVVSLATPNSRLRLYPNPNDGSFTVYGVMPETKKVAIEVVNVIGQVMLVAEQKVVDNILNKQLNINELAPGVYLLRVIGNTGTQTIRFTVQR